MQLAPSLHRVGSSSLVNSYLVEDAGAITVIDAGLRRPRSWAIVGQRRASMMTSAELGESPHLEAFTRFATRSPATCISVRRSSDRILHAGHGGSKESMPVTSSPMNATPACSSLSNVPGQQVAEQQQQQQVV